MGLEKHEKNEIKCGSLNCVLMTAKATFVISVHYF